MRWTIAYWTGGSTHADVSGSTDAEWRAAPSENILWVDLEWQARGKTYRWRLQGGDHVWIDGDFFGSWSDPWNAWAGSSTRRYVEGEAATVAAEHGPPPEAVKHGVMVPEPYAEAFGFTGGGK